MAVALVFLATTGFGGSTGLTAGAGVLATAVLAFNVRLRFGTILSLSLVLTAVTFFLAAWGVFLADRFLGDFAIFKVLTLDLVRPPLARLPLARRAGDFAAAVFFGFFMATAFPIRTVAEPAPNVNVRGAPPPCWSTWMAGKVSRGSDPV